MPHRPAIVVEVLDRHPGVVAELRGLGRRHRLRRHWAQKAVEAGADIVAVTLRSCHPDPGRQLRRERGAHRDACWRPCRCRSSSGLGAADKDNEVLVAVAEEA